MGRELGYKGPVSLECGLSFKLPEPQIGSLLQEIGLVFLMVQDWLFLFLLCYLHRNSVLFDSSHCYLHLRLRCWRSPIWEVEKGMWWGHRLLTLAIVPGCSATPHPARAQEVFVAEGLSFISLHKDILAAVPISRGGQVWATVEWLCPDPWGMEKLRLALESGEMFERIKQ